MRRVSRTANSLRTLSPISVELENPLYRVLVDDVRREKEEL
jgi:hypothetical protein